MMPLTFLAISPSPIYSKIPHRSGLYSLTPLPFFLLFLNLLQTGFHFHHSPKLLFSRSPSTSTVLCQVIQIWFMLIFPPWSNYVTRLPECHSLLPFIALAVPPNIIYWFLFFPLSSKHCEPSAQRLSSSLSTLVPQVILSSIMTSYGNTYHLFSKSFTFLFLPQTSPWSSRLVYLTTYWHLTLCSQKPPHINMLKN